MDCSYIGVTYTFVDMFNCTLVNAGLPFDFVVVGILAAFVFFAPDSLGHPDNYIPANPMVTPPHIVPEWYFLPFYAILRAVTFNMNIYMLAGLALLSVFMVEFVWRHKPKYLSCSFAVMMLVLGGIVMAVVLALSFGHMREH